MKSRPGRENCPTRARYEADKKAAANDPQGGVSTKHNERIRKREALKSARASRSKDMGVSGSGQRRSGMVPKPVTLGRYGATGKR